MKTTNIRTMRDIPTIQGVKNRSMPTNIEQVMSELTQLVHERIRLERENTIWLSNQKKTQSRIQQVQERIDLLQRRQDELYPRLVVTQPIEEVEKKSRKYREVNLEY